MKHKLPKQKIPKITLRRHFDVQSHFGLVLRYFPSNGFASILYKNYRPFKQPHWTTNSIYLRFSGHMLRPRWISIQHLEIVVLYIFCEKQIVVQS